MSRQFLLMVNETICAKLASLMPEVQCLEVMGMDMQGSPNMKVLVTPYVSADVIMDSIPQEAKVNE